MGTGLGDFRGGKHGARKLTGGKKPVGTDEFQSPRWFYTQVVGSMWLWPTEQGECKRAQRSY